MRLFAPPLPQVYDPGGFRTIQTKGRNVMRTLLIGLVILFSSLVAGPGKTDKAFMPRPEGASFACPLNCSREVTCPDGRVFCNACLARQAGEKNCT